MRILVGLLVLIMSLPALADSVRCYTGNGIKVYDHQVSQVTYDPNRPLIAFIESSTGKLVISSLDCIAKIDDPNVEN